MEDAIQSALVGLTTQVSHLTQQVSILVVEMTHLKESGDRVQNTPQEIALIKQQLAIQGETQKTQTVTNRWLIGVGLLMIGTMIAGMGLIFTALPHLK